MEREPSLHRLKDVPAGTSAEARAGELMRQVPAPAPLREDAVARLSATLARGPRRSRHIARGWRVAMAVGGVAAGSVAFAAAAHFDLWTRLAPTAPRQPVVVPESPAAPEREPMPEPELEHAPAPTSVLAKAAESAPAAPRPLRVRPPAAPPVREAPVALPTAVGGGSLAAESALLGQAMKARLAGHPQEALGAMNSYAVQFPNGQMKAEAVLARINALLDLGRRKEALAVLDAMEPPELASLARSNELRVVHAELLAENGRCKDALDTFDSALSGALAPAVEERARYGRALCLARGDDAEGLRLAVGEYLERFPDGRHAAQLRSLSPR